jgi:hypothetical protein
LEKRFQRKVCEHYVPRWKIYNWNLGGMKMATTVASRKAKARRLQQEMVDRLLSIFPDLTERDIRSTPMGVNESDVWLSEEALKRIPYDIECKNCEKLNVWDAIKQSEDRVFKKGTKLSSLIVFKRNRSDAHCIISLTELINMLSLIHCLRRLNAQPR